MSGPLLSIVLPVFNQADHIRSIVEEYVQALDRVGRGFELLLVPNGCSHKSRDCCRDLAASDPRIRLIDTQGRGWGHAVRTGLAHAAGEILCYTNSARTSAQDLILVLLYAVVFPNLVVKANRKIREGPLRRLGSLLYNLEARALFDLSYWDINGTPKVFPRSFGALLGLAREDDLVDLEFLAICRREGYPVVEVPIFSVRRHGGRSTTTIASAVRLYWGAYRFHSSSR